MKKYEIIIEDFDEGVYEGTVIIDNVDTLDVKSITEHYNYYTDILINNKIKIKIPGQFLEVIEIKEMN